MTNPTPSADELSERVAALLGSTPWEKQPSVIAEQIRLARADERRKTLEEAARVAERFAVATLSSSGNVLYKKCANAIRALNESGEPGEAAQHGTH